MQRKSRLLNIQYGCRASKQITNQVKPGGLIQHTMPSYVRHRVYRTTTDPSNRGSGRLKVCGLGAHVFRWTKRVGSPQSGPSRSGKRCGMTILANQRKLAVDKAGNSESTLLSCCDRLERVERLSWRATEDQVADCIPGNLDARKVAQDRNLCIRNDDTCARSILDDKLCLSILACDAADCA